MLTWICLYLPSIFIFGWGKARVGGSREKLTLCLGLGLSDCEVQTHAPCLLHLHLGELSLFSYVSPRSDLYVPLSASQCSLMFVPCVDSSAIVFVAFLYLIVCVYLSMSSVMVLCVQVLPIALWYHLSIVAFNLSPCHCCLYLCFSCFLSMFMAHTGYDLYVCQFLCHSSLACFLCCIHLAVILVLSLLSIHPCLHVSSLSLHLLHLLSCSFILVCDIFYYSWMFHCLCCPNFSKFKGPNHNHAWFFSALLQEHCYHTCSPLKVVNVTCHLRSWLI